MVYISDAGLLVCGLFLWVVMRVDAFGLFAGCVLWWVRFWWFACCVLDVCWMWCCVCSLIYELVLAGFITFPRVWFIVLIYSALGGFRVLDVVCFLRGWYNIVKFGFLIWWCMVVLIGGFGFLELWCVVMLFGTWGWWVWLCCFGGLVLVVLFYVFSWLVDLLI